MELTLASEDQIWEQTALPILQAIGTRVPATDYALITGVSVRGGIQAFGNKPACAAWTVSTAARANVRTIGILGQAYYFPPYFRCLGIRPIIPACAAAKIKPQSLAFIQKPNRDTITLATYGRYPQTIASRSVAEKLTKLYQKKELQMTGHQYAFDSKGLTKYELKSHIKHLPEYVLDGQTYVRVRSKVQGLGLLSDGQKTYEGKLDWVQVRPIQWFVDPTGCWVSTHALLGGVQFNRYADYNGNFKKTDMYLFLNKYLVNDLAPQIIRSQKKISPKNQDRQRS